LGSAESVAKASASLEASLSHLIALQSFAEPTESVVESFDCSPALFGLVIGKSGQNIKNVQSSIPEVLSVRCLSEGRVEIVAQSLQAAKLARQKLEVSKRVLTVHKEVVAILIGKAYSGLKEIEELSGATKIRVNNISNEKAEVAVVGFGNAVTDAVHLLQVHIDWIQLVLKSQQYENECIEELNELRAVTGYIQQKLKLESFGSDQNGQTSANESDPQKTQSSSENVLSTVLSARPSKSPLLRHKTTLAKSNLNVQTINGSNSTNTVHKSAVPIVNIEAKENLAAPIVVNNESVMNGKMHRKSINKMTKQTQKSAWKRVGT